MFKVLFLIPLLPLLGGVCFADDLSEAGIRDAARDFAQHGPRVASFGGYACYMGHGLTDEEKKLLQGAPNGPSYCDCTQSNAGAREGYVVSYNKQMVALVKERKKKK